MVLTPRTASIESRRRAVPSRSARRVWGVLDRTALRGPDAVGPSRINVDGDSDRGPQAPCDVSGHRLLSDW